MRYFNYGSDLVDYRRGCFVISKNEHVSPRVTAELDRLADEKEASEAREAKLREALKTIYGFSGNQGKQLWDARVVARDALAASPDAGENDVAKLREEHAAMKAALVKATEACDANAQTAADAMRREACLRQDRAKLMEWLLETQAVAADLVGHPYLKADAEMEINEALAAAQKETSR